MVSKLISKDHPSSGPLFEIEGELLSSALLYFLSLEGGRGVKCIYLLYERSTGGKENQGL